MHSFSTDLSIVIVNWNTCDMLREVLLSVFQSTEEVRKGSFTLDVIVVDNASDDMSADMVKAEFPQVVLIENTENRGFAAANNQGFERAKGRYVLLLNSDTIVLGNVLEASVTYMDQPEHRSIGAMGCRVLNTDHTMQATCSMFPSLINLTLLTSGLAKLPWPRFLGRYHMRYWMRDSECKVDVISGCYLMIRREVLEKTGGLDEDFFFYGEETDWCRRITKAGWELWFAPVGEIIHHGSASANKLNHRRDILLTDALVHLHRKHGGRLSMLIAWCILFIFNISRAVFWSILSLIKGSARFRARHFWAVSRGLIFDESQNKPRVKKAR